MDQNFRTLIYAAPRMEIDELLQVRRQLEKILGKEFVLAADSDEEALNKVVSINILGLSSSSHIRFLIFIQVAANINIRIPEEGEKVKRLIDIARERNIDYKPSAESMAALRDYCDRKGMENPLGGSSHHVVVDNLIPPPYNPNMGFEVNYQMPPPQNYGGGMPSYQPLQQAPPVYVQPVVPMMPAYMPPPANMPPPVNMPPPSNNGVPVMGEPVQTNNSTSSSFPSFYQPSNLPPINNFQPIHDDGEKPQFQMNRGYTLYDPSGVHQFIPEQ